MTPDLQSARQSDGNGWIEIKNNPISKVGVFPYLGKSIDPALEPEKIYYVYRPEEELSNPETIKSFRLLPWVDDHPARLLGPEDAGRVAAEEKGVEGVIGEEIYFNGGVLYANIKMFSDNLAELIESGKRELSVGYGCRYELCSGIWNGQRYDAIQRSIRGNHLATVSEGRMGPDVAVLDHLTFTFDAKDIQMADTEKNEEKKELTMDEVGAALKTLGENHAAMKGIIDKHFAADDKEDDMGACDADEDKEKKEKEAADKAAKDAEEKEKDKEAQDSKQLRVALDAAVSQLKQIGSEVDGWKKEGFKRTVREIKQRDQLASQISNFVGAFDASELTLGEVAEYGVKKLGLSVEAGHEVSALGAYFKGRTPPSQESAFSLDAAQDGKADEGKSNILDFYSKAEKAA